VNEARVAKSSALFAKRSANESIANYTLILPRSSQRSDPPHISLSAGTRRISTQAKHPRVHGDSMACSPAQRQSRMLPARLILDSSSSRMQGAIHHSQGADMSSHCADYRSGNRQCAERWRAPDAKLLIFETGAMDNSNVCQRRTRSRVRCGLDPIYYDLLPIQAPCASRIANTARLGSETSARVSRYNSVAHSALFILETQRISLCLHSKRVRQSYISSRTGPQPPLDTCT